MATAFVANPVGNPFANPISTDGYSPELQAWLRRQALDAAIAHALREGRRLRESAVQAQAPAQVQAPVQVQAQGPAQIMPLAPVPVPLEPVRTGAVGYVQDPRGVAPPFDPESLTSTGGYSTAPLTPTAAPPVVAGEPLAFTVPPVGVERPVLPDGTAIGGAATAVLPPEIAPGPPKTPEEVVARKNGWKRFLEEVKVSPQLQLALLRFGTQILQPIAPGQTPLGHFGQALQGSIDYVSAQQAAQAKLAREAAETARIRAETETEAERPEQVKAQAKLLQAQAGLTAEEMQKARRLLPYDVERVRKEVDKLAAETGVHIANEAAILTELELKGSKAYADAVIEELKARAWHYRNPHASQRDAQRARAAFIEDMSKTLLVADDELRELAQTDRALALEKARVRANDRWFAAGAQISEARETAKSTLELLQAQYAQAVAINDPSVLDAKKNIVPFETYLLRKSEDILLTPEQRAMMARVIREYQSAKKAQPQRAQPQGAQPQTGRPPLESFEKPY